jgi:predicted aspartyl protease
MELDTMGRVTTEATIENLGDLWDVREGRLPADSARRITVADALVDTGATLLSIPTAVIHQLGLAAAGMRRVRSSSHVVDATMYEAVRLTVQGRTCTMDVIEVPDGVPVLIGQIPLEHLDLVVDLGARRLIGNPAHGGEHVYESY